MTSTRERIERIAVKEALTYPKGTRDYNVAYAACIAALTALCEEMERDTERLDWMECKRQDCDGRTLTRCFIPDDKSLREHIDELISQELPQPPAT